MGPQRPHRRPRLTRRPRRGLRPCARRPGSMGQRGQTGRRSSPPTGGSDNRPARMPTFVVTEPGTVDLLVRTRGLDEMSSRRCCDLAADEAAAGGGFGSIRGHRRRGGRPDWRSRCHHRPDARPVPAAATALLRFRSPGDRSGSRGRRLRFTECGCRAHRTTPRPSPRARSLKSCWTNTSGRSYVGIVHRGNGATGGPRDLARDVTDPTGPAAARASSGGPRTGSERAR